MNVQRIAEVTDNKIVFDDIDKNCLSKNPDLKLSAQFKISKIGRRKPIKIGKKHTKKHAKDFNESNFCTGEGLKFEDTES